MQELSPNVFFSNGSNLSGIFQEMIESAKKEIIVIHGYLSSKSIIKKIFQAHRRGVEVTILTNREYAKNIDSLLKSKVEVRFVKGITGILHHKIILIDGKICVLGSCNLHDQSIFDDDENLIELRSEKIYDSIKFSLLNFDYDLATYEPEGLHGFIHFFKRNVFIITSSILSLLLSLQIIFYSSWW